MGQIEDFRLYINVVDSGGIARAADTLGIAKSAVSRRLSQLELRYDVRLIKRDSRNWELTAAGRELYQRASAMVADADDIDADFMHLSQSLRGPLSISIAREFGLSFLQPTLFQFKRDNPEIDLTIDFEDRIIDLDSENYDLAVRITTEDHAGLIVEQIGVSHFGLYASPEYLEEHGTPKQPGDLKAHQLLHYGSARRARWQFLYDGKKSTVEFHPALNSNCGPFLLSSALCGFGIAQLPDFVVAETMENEKLIPVLPNITLADFGIHIVYSANRRVNNRMRALMDALILGCAELGR